MKKADFIIIAAVAVIAGFLVFFLYGLNNAWGAYVRLEVDGKVIETLSLDEDTVREIETENNGRNVLVIKDGEAKISEANCPDGICTNHSKIHRNGESIICLPHKVVVTVINEKDADEIDAVV